MKLQKLLLVLLLLAPVFSLIPFLHGTQIDFHELWWALKNSFIQASISAILTVVFGLWSAFGYYAIHGIWKNQIRQIFSVLALIPNVVPPLFILLAFFQVIDPFPMGIIGIILLHIFINYGWVSLVFIQAIENKLGNLIEVSEVMGCSRWRFRLQIVIPILMKEIISCFFFAFAICFTSFSIPLIVGGGTWTSIEILIYEKLRLSNDWGNAVYLAMIQMLIIFSLSFFLKQQSNFQIQKVRESKLIASYSGIFIFGIPLVLFFYGYFDSLYSGLSQIGSLYEYLDSIILAFIGSFIMSGLVGAFTLIVLLWIATLIHENDQLHRFLNSYISPSTSLTCFVILIYFFPNKDLWPLIKIPFAFVLINLSSFYRSGWGSLLLQFDRQREISDVLGAKPSDYILRILFPQILPQAGRIAGLAAAWMAGDFAISKILAYKHMSLAMLIENLMSSYRFNQAAVLSLGIIIVSLIQFSFFRWSANVLSQRLKTSSR